MLKKKHNKVLNITQIITESPRGGLPHLSPVTEHHAPNLRRWYVHQDHGMLGPLTAAEVREGLRNGSIGPFDQVSAQGMKHRVNVVDVDEIFVSVTEEPPMNEAGFAKREETQNYSRSGIYTPQNEEKEVTNPFSGDPIRLGLRRDKSPHSAGRHDKHYFLHHKRYGRLGPLSAREIQALYNRGILNPYVTVQHMGHQETISISQFISRYSEKQLIELNKTNASLRTAKNGAQFSLPNARATHELKATLSSRPAKRSKLKLYGILFLGMLIGASAVFIGLNHEPMTSQAPLEQQNLKPEKPIGRSAARVPAEVAPKLASPATLKPKPMAPKLYDPYAAAVGHEIIVGPLSYGLPDLESCPDKCQLKLVDKNKRVLSGIFFKGSFGSKLRKLGGSAHFRGHLKREHNSYSLYINDAN